MHVLASQFTKAVMEGDVPVIAWLAPCDINMPFPNRCNAVHIAAQRNHALAVLALVSRGGALDSFNDEGYSPLHIAAKHGAVESVRALVELKASLDILGVPLLHLTDQLLIPWLRLVLPQRMGRQNVSYCCAHCLHHCSED